MNIIQLSDIHLRKSEVISAQDPNFGLRNELLRDIRERRAKHGNADIIVLSGAVAFAGDLEEFVFARSWLEALCDAAGSELEAIFVVPGNHDVVRKIADSKMVQLLHQDIKSKSGASLDAAIADHLIDADSGRLLYLSLENYNAFAQQCLCDLLPPNRTRAVRDIPLNDESTLRLWGLNTAFVSSSHDIENDLFVDTASLQITREAGVINLVVAHHRPSWLRQRQARRGAQHGDRFELLRTPCSGTLTLGEARAVEQALILRNPEFQNIRNSISPTHSYYEDAVAWGEWWLSTQDE